MALIENESGGCVRWKGGMVHICQYTFDVKQRTMIQELGIKDNGCM